jgi:hypothetical protein
MSATQLTWSTIPVGARTGELTIEVTDQLVDDYLQIMGWFDLPWFTRPTAPFTARVAPPDLLPKLGMTALVQAHVWERLGPNIRVRQAFSFHAPVLVGARVRGVGHLHDKYERRGKHFVVMRVVYRGEDGTTLVVDERTQLMLGESVRVAR